MFLKHFNTHKHNEHSASTLAEGHELDPTLHQQPDSGLGPACGVGGYAGVGPFVSQTHVSKSQAAIR